MRLAKPRIAPVQDAALTDEQKEILAPMGERVLNIFRTMVQAPKAAKGFLAWGNYVLSKKNDLPPREQKKVPEVCGSLREALENLDKDRAFLKAGGVMDDDFIDAYIELKMQEVMRLQLHPHPVEFDMYFAC